MGRLGLLGRLLLWGLWFLLGRGNLGGRGSGGRLLDLNFFLFLLTLFFSLKIFFSDGDGAFLDLIESGQVESSIALGDEDCLIEQGKEKVDDNMGAVLGEGGDEEFLVFALDKKRD